jgi:hypothetical protein
MDELQKLEVELSALPTRAPCPRCGTDLWRGVHVQRAGALFGGDWAVGFLSNRIHADGSPVSRTIDVHVKLVGQCEAEWGEVAWCPACEHLVNPESLACVKGEKQSVKVEEWLRKHSEELDRKIRESRDRPTAH